MDLAQHHAGMLALASALAELPQDLLRVEIGELDRAVLDAGVRRFPIARFCATSAIASL